jgi:DNA replication initiation complex subunit (GINS family)
MDGASHDVKENVELPLLTFNALYTILRSEKRSKTLQQFPPLFYEALQEFITSKKKEVERLTKEQSPQLKKEEHVLKNIIKMAEELFVIRGTKLSRLALENSVVEGEALSEELVCDFEKEFYTSIQNHFKKFKKIIE